MQPSGVDISFLYVGLHNSSGPTNFVTTPHNVNRVPRACPKHVSPWGHVVVCIKLRLVPLCTYFANLAYHIFDIEMSSGFNVVRVSMYGMYICRITARRWSSISSTGLILLFTILSLGIAIHLSIVLESSELSWWFKSLWLNIFIILVPFS